MSRQRPDLLFLFIPEERPDRSRLLELVSAIGGLSVSVDRASPQGDPPYRTALWCELQSGGMTFECSGIAPGPAERLPNVQEWIAVPAADRAQRLRCVGLALGPHVRAGQAVLPILRGLLSLASAMASELEGCRGICWTASGIVIDPAAFGASVARWLDGGGFPAQLTIAIKDGLAGGIESRGLTYFTGQELRLEPGAAPDRQQSVALAQRLVGQLIYRGTLGAPEQAIAPDGTPLRLEPSTNGRFVRVWAG